MFAEFKKFAMRGNVIDLAVGVVIGAAFGAIVASLVKDIIMPPIGYAMGGIDFSNFFITLKGPAATTLAEAQKAGAVTINYGRFPQHRDQFSDRRPGAVRADPWHQPPSDARPPKNPRHLPCRRKMSCCCARFAIC